jgi:hypothetical protein
MTVKTAIAATFISLATLAAVPAHATDVSVKLGFGTPHWGGYHQPHPAWQQHTLKPVQVRWILQSRGYRDISYFDRRGNVYQLRAKRDGHRYFLVVSAHNGRVIQRTRI